MSVVNKIRISNKESWKENLQSLRKSGTATFCINADAASEFLDVRTHADVLAKIVPLNIGDFVYYPGEIGLDRIGPCEGGRTVEWKLSVTYSTVKADRAEDIEQHDPCERSARCSYEDQPVELPAIADANGKPFINPAGDYLEGNFVVAMERVYSFSKNYCDEPDFTLYASNTTNSDYVTLAGVTWPPNTLRVGPFKRPEVETENDKDFLKLSWTMIGRYWGWHRIVPARGFNELRHLDDQGNETGATNAERIEKFRILDSSNEPIQEPAYIDTSGRAIPVNPGAVLGNITLNLDGVFSANFSLSESYKGSLITLKDGNGNVYFVRVADLFSETTGSLDGDVGIPLGTYTACASGMHVEHYQDYYMIPLGGVMPLCQALVGTASPSAFSSAFSNGFGS